MKKQAILVALTFLMLVGCGQENMNNQSDFSSSTTEKIRTSGKGEKTSEGKEISSKPSEASSRESRSGMTDMFKQNELLYASTLEKLKSDQSEGHAQVYTFYDIDDNGTAELLTGHLSTTSGYI